MPEPNFEHYYTNFAYFARLAHLNVAENNKPALKKQIIDLTNIYKFARGGASAKSVLAGEDITDDDIAAFIDYLDAGLKNDLHDLNCVNKLEKDFYNGVSQLKLSDMEGMNENSVQFFNNLRYDYADLFSELHEKERIAPINANNLDNMLVNMGTFGQIIAAKNNSYKADVKTAADTTYRMLQPATEGKTIAQLAKMYPVVGASTYVSDLYGAVTNINKNNGEKLVESRSDLCKNGFVTLDDDHETFVTLYNGEINAVEQRYGNRLRECDKATPAIIYGERVPEFGAAVKRIANDAKKAFSAAYETRSGRPIGNAEKAMVESYGNAVESQFTRLLLKGNYEKKCREAVFTDDLKEDIAYFVNNEQSNVLPYYFEQNMVDGAMNAALQVTIDAYPAAQRNLAGLNTDLDYSEDRTVLPVRNMAEISPANTPSQKLNNDMGTLVKDIYNKFEPYNAGKRVIGFYSERNDGANVETWKNTAANLTFTPGRIADINSTAALFDSLLVGKNEQLKKTMENADVQKQIGTYKDAAGKDVGDATKLCYIDGESVDTYIQSRLGAINRRRYNRLTEDEKVNYRKAAVVQAILSGGDKVDVKTYVQKPDMSVEAFVTTVTENADEYDARYTTPENIVKNVNDFALLRRTRTNKIKEEDTLGAEMNAQIEAKKQEIRLKRENQLKIERNLARARARKEREQFLQQHPQQELRDLQNDIKRADMPPAYPALNLSSSADMNSSTIVPNLTIGEMEFRLEFVDFEYLESVQIFMAMQSFNSEVLNKNPWIANSLNNPVVSEELNGDETQLFYIDNKPVEDYIKEVMPTYKDMPVDRRKGLRVMAIMNAIISKQHRVDAKGYVQKEDGTCEVKVSEVEYARNRSTDPAVKAYNTMQARARAERLIARDTIANKINNNLRQKTGEQLRDIQVNASEIAAANRRVNDLLVPQFNSNSALLSILPDVPAIAKLSNSSSFDPDKYIINEYNDNDREMDQKISNVDFTDIRNEDLRLADKLFDDIVLKYEPWIADTINNPDVAEELKGDVTKLFYIDGKTAEDYVKGVVPHYNVYSPEDKKSLGKLAVLNALVLSDTHLVDAKGYVQTNGKICDTVVKNIKYGRPVRSIVNRLESQYGTFAERSANIIANDNRAQIFNVNEAYVKQQITDIAKLYKSYVNSQNNIAVAPEEVLFSDAVITPNDVNAVNTFFDNGVNAGVADANVSAFRDYVVNALSDLRVDKALGLGQIGDVSNHSALNRMANTLNDIDTLNKVCANSLNKKQQSNLQNLKIISEMFRDYNSEDPAKAMAATMLYNMFSGNFNGKTLGQISDMYPANDKGKTYFSVVSDEIHKLIDDKFSDITYDEVQNYRAHGNLPDLQKNKEMGERYLKSIESINNAYYGNFVTERDRTYNNNLDDAKKHKFSKVSTRGTEGNFLDDMHERVNFDNSKVIKDENLPALLYFENPDLPDYQGAINYVVSDAAARLGASPEVEAEFSRTAKNILARELVSRGYIDCCQSVKNREDLINDMTEFTNGGRVTPYYIDLRMVSKALNMATGKVNADYNLNLEEPNVWLYDEGIIKPELVTCDRLTKLHSYKAADDDVVLKTDLYAERCDVDPKRFFTYHAGIDIINGNGEIRMMADEKQKFEYLKGNSKYSLKALLADQGINDMDIGEVKEDCLGQATNLFYIDGKRVDEYITKEMGIKEFDTVCTEEEKQTYAAYVLLSAIYSGNQVDVKQYCRGADCTCEVKVLPVVTDKSQEMSAELKEKHKETAAEIIKNDKIAKKINTREAPVFEARLKKYADDLAKYKDFEKVKSSPITAVNDYNSSRDYAAQISAMQAQQAAQQPAPQAQQPAPQAQQPAPQQNQQRVPVSIIIDNGAAANGSPRPKSADPLNSQRQNNAPQTGVSKNSPSQNK